MTETIPEGAPLPKKQGSWFVWRLVVVWLLGLALGLLVEWRAPVSRVAEWHVLVIGVVLIATFLLQIGTAQKEGFIARVSFSIAGGVLASLAAELLRFIG